MSTSTHISLVRNADEKFEDYIRLKEQCDEAGVSYPLELTAYFGNLVSESEDTIRDDMSTCSLGSIDYPNTDYPNTDNPILEEIHLQDGIKLLIDLSSIPDEFSHIEITTRS